MPKVYEVTTRESVDDAQVNALLNGVVLHGEAQSLSAAACSRLDDRRLRLTVTLGKYHLVKEWSLLPATASRVCTGWRSAACCCPQACLQGSGCGWDPGN